MGKRKQERRSRQTPRRGGDPLGDPLRDGGPHGAAPPPGLAEELEQTVAGVVGASDAQAELKIDVAASWMAASEERWPALGQAVLIHTDRRLGSLWRYGWQPADVVRVVHRDADARHGRLAVDLIAGEARRYAVDGLDPRWAGQLSEVGADVWWGADDEWLPGTARREKLDRFGTATVLLELLRLLSRLPRLEVLIPPPNASGAAGEDSAAWRAGPAASPMLGRIRALLAKAESTEFPAEAEALTAKAQQLMAEHSINAALLAARGTRKEVPSGIRLGIDSPYEQPKAMLLQLVADANRCRSVWSQNLGFATVVGFQTDLDAVELLFTSLLLQADTALQAHDRRSRTGSRSRSFRQSFLLSYAARIGERLTAATDAAVAAADLSDGDPQTASGESSTAGSDLLPVLAARLQAVDDTAESWFPHQTYSRSARAQDGEGWTSGRAAADRANLGRGSGSLPMP